MWFSGGYKSECVEFHDALERISNIEESDSLDAVTLNALLTRLPDPARQHASACSDCRSAADEWLEIRGMFQLQDSGAQPGPYFLGRVMAAIAEGEAGLEKGSQTWAAVPRLASRLSILAALTLLVAGSWLYQQPRHATVASASSAQSNEGLVEGGGTIQDDFLLNPADR
jgi:hypothetical protein